MSCSIPGRAFRVVFSSTSLRHLFTALAVLLLGAPFAAAQDIGGHTAGDEAGPQTRRTFTGTAQVTAVDLVIDVRDEEGRVPADLAAADFEVLEDGDPKPVLGVERFSRGTALGRRTARAAAEEPPPEIGASAWAWNQVIYLDQVLTSSASIRKATQQLAAQAGRLTSLGTVEIVLADPYPQRVLEPTRSARLVEQTLLRLGRETGGRDAIRQLRRRFFTHLLTQRELEGTGQSTARGEIPLTTDASMDRAMLTRSAMIEESDILLEQQDRMLAWTSAYLESGPRVLMLVNDGYDLDPRDFYLSGIEDQRMWSEVNALLQNYSTVDRYRDVVRSMAAAGWVCVNLALSDFGDHMSVVSADVSGKGRVGNISGSFNADQALELPDSLMSRPRDPLAHLAQETGGELVTAAGRIPETLVRLGQRVRLTYQVERKPDGALHRVEVRPRRPGLEVRAPEWSGSPAPQAVASARARRLLEGGTEAGDLPVTAAVGLGGEAALTDRRRGTLQARVDLAALKGLLPAVSNLRVTFAVALEDQLPFVRHDLVDDQQLAGLDGWTYTVPISLPPQAGKVSVLVEELSTGSWGGALAARVRGPLPEPPEGRHVAAIQRQDGQPTAAEQGYDLPVDLLPEPKAVVLVPPAGRMVTGRVRFDALVTRADVERVAFLLDGERVELVGRPPFEARIDVGELPRAVTVEAVAYAAGGEELGRDSVVVNQGAGSFRVRLIEPRDPERVGPVDVEADVGLRDGDRLDRVEISWNNELVATLYEPPFRQQVRVPPEAPVGYIAVTAYLEDGSSAEDVIFMNGPGSDERVEVRLVELFTVVTDPTGRPIRGLTPADFQVYEEGERQSISEVRDGSALPLSLALLVDTSASMAESLQQVEIAAVDFLYLNLRRGDRAMLVSFDSEPRLLQPLTGDLDAVARKVSRLQAGGYTALCDALAFSLVQMQNVEGRRALVVLSDGVGREERVGYATCLRLAQQVGVPIYAIILDRDGEERQDREAAAKVEKIAGAVGGRVFYVSDLENLGSVYGDIRRELSSQYLISYYPDDGEGGDGGWRAVRLEVLQPGLTARTVTGYWP